MKNIYTFDNFIFLFESKENLDKKLISALKRITSNTKINQFLGEPAFGGIYTKPYSSDWEEIFYVWNGVENKFEGVLFSNGEFYAKDTLKIKHRWELRDLIWERIENLLKKAKEEHTFNPFQNGVENIPIIKDFLSKGMEIVSTENEKANGTLVLRFPSSSFDYVIQTSGYIRRKGISGFISSGGAVHKLEDLEPMILRVYSYFIKDNLEGAGIDSKTIKSILSKLNNTDSPEYSVDYYNITNQYPESSLYLPEPKGGGNKELIKGARILGRLGEF